MNTVTWLPSVALAGSVLLRERSRAMDAMQLLVTTIVKSSGSQVGTSCFYIGYIRITLHVPLACVLDFVVTGHRSYTHSVSNLQEALGVSESWLIG